MNDPTPEQIARLPKWAQHHIFNQTRQIDRLEETIDAINSEHSDPHTFVVRGMDLLPIGGDSSTVRFVIGGRSRDYIDIHHRGDRVEVLASHRVTVQPRASNHVVLALGPI